MPASPGVVIATLANHSVPLEFLSSWGDLHQWDATQGSKHLTTPGGSMKMTSGPRIAEARSQLVDCFFAEPLFEGAEWLLMVDSDMVFEANMVERLMEVADPKETPILGGLCFAGGRSHDPYPTIYRQVELAGHDGKSFVGVEPIREYPRDELVRVGATGGACLLVHRQVFIAMSHEHPRGWGTFPDGRKNPYPWFVEGTVTPNGEPVGEDIAFCMRADQLGIPIHVHTGVKLGHVKHFILDEAWFDASRAARQDAVEALETDRTNVGEVELPVARPNRAARREAARAALRANAADPEKVTVTP